MKETMTFEKARENFLNSLNGAISGSPDFEPIVPSEEALNRLAVVQEPMDDVCLALLREEIVDDILTDEDPSLAIQHQTWAQAVVLIREYIRRDENYSMWRCPKCKRERYDTSEIALVCECGEEMKRISIED
jgi:hypothetical protein